MSVILGSGDFVVNSAQKIKNTSLYCVRSGPVKVYDLCGTAGCVSVYAVKYTVVDAAA